MRFGESLAMAVSNLRSNKMRAALTLLGVVIGIASVITILTVGNSMKTQASQVFDDAGAANISLRVTPRPSQAEIDELGYDPYQYSDGTVTDPDAPLSTEDIENLRDRFDDRLEAIAIGESYTDTAQVQITTPDNQRDGTLQFINADYQNIKNTKLAAGRLITAEDVTARAPVAVVPYRFVEEFYGGNVQAALGATVMVESEEGFADLQIVGIEKQQKASGGLFSGVDNSVRLMVPYTLGSDFSSTLSDGFNNLLVKGASGEDKAKLIEDIKSFLAPEYPESAEYMLRVEDKAGELEEFNKVITMMSVAIAAIGGISLFVGGIGVMNIMLITVTERTREIGVRKALGATRKDIRTQFVTEAMVVCLIGGLVGIVSGTIFGLIASKLMGTMVFPPVAGIIGSLLFCVVIGLFFGWYPANRAARLDPIEALRYE